MDYYRLLGLTKDASHEDIKKAYRKLARELHPDVNSNNDSEDKFKEVTQAYQILTNPKKKREYDRKLNRKNDNAYRRNAYRSYRKQADSFRQSLNNESNTNKSDFNTEKSALRIGLKNFKSTFSRITKSVASKAQNISESIPSYSNDKRLEVVSVLELEISIEESLKGVTRNIKLQNSDNSKRSLSVIIPQGVRTGTVLRMRSKTPPIEEVIFVVKLQKHKYITIDPRGITLEVPITIKEAFNGAQFNLTLWDERNLQVKIPAFTQSGTEICYPGQGIKKPYNISTDLFLRFLVVIPNENNKNSQIDFNSYTSSIKEAIDFIDRFYSDNIRK